MQFGFRVDHDTCYDETCFCTNVFRVELGDVVELIVVNEANKLGDGAHPIHLHGYTFRLVGMGIVSTFCHINYNLYFIIKV